MTYDMENEINELKELGYDISKIPVRLRFGCEVGNRREQGIVLDILAKARKQKAVQDDPTVRGIWRKDDARGWIAQFPKDVKVGDFVVMAKKSGEEQEYQVSEILGAGIVKRGEYTGQYVCFANVMKKASRVNHAAAAYKVGRSLGVNGGIWDEEDMEQYL